MRESFRGVPSILDLFKPALRGLPRLQHLILKGLGDDGLVWLKLPPPMANTGKALASRRRQIENVLTKGPHVYKVGVTADPLFRFYKEPTHESPSPGYYRSPDRFKFMDVIYAAESFDEAALMEAVLIETYKGMPGNRNVRPGGEGRQCGQGPFFTYFVFKSAM